MVMEVIEGSPPISLSLIVRESKWDVNASGTDWLFSFFTLLAYIILVFNNAFLYPTIPWAV